MAAVTLVGPPEIYTLKLNPNPTTAQTTFSTTTTTNDVSVDPSMGFTENMSPTFLFPDTPSETLVERLKLAWSHNPLTTLKLVCNLRGVRGTGKSNKEGFYAAALWLHENHPKTLATNIPSLADFGYFKDLPEILYRLLEQNAERRVE